MNIARARQILRDVSDHLVDPARSAVYIDACSMDVQMVTIDGHVWTLSLHEVDTGDVLARGKVVQAFSPHGKDKGRLN